MFFLLLKYKSNNKSLKLSKQLFCLCINVCVSVIFTRITVCKKYLQDSICNRYQYHQRYLIIFIYYMFNNFITLGSKL